MTLHMSWAKQKRVQITVTKDATYCYPSFTKAHLATSDGRALCGRQLDATKLCVSVELPRCEACEGLLQRGEFSVSVVP